MPIFLLFQVFTFTSTPQQLHVFDTAPNPRGLCSLSPSSTNSLLALPGTHPGHTQLVDLASPDKAPLGKYQVPLGTQDL